MYTSNRCYRAHRALDRTLVLPLFFGIDSGFVSNACDFAAPCNKFAAPVYRGTVSIGEMSKQTTQRCSRVRRTAEDARAAQARNTAARRAARAAAPVEEACAARARQTDAQRAARAAAPAEERRATQARDTAAHRAARAAAPAEERRTPPGRGLFPDPGSEAEA